MLWSHGGSVASSIVYYTEVEALKPLYVFTIAFFPQPLESAAEQNWEWRSATESGAFGETTSAVLVTEGNSLPLESL